ncbi:D-alanyl-D-alanine carboxypeptidase family protein [Paenibacillus faecalis]|uniref:D-alanyl-D-alanine carboxypeptidase family protein n=1 Tax=Paenibacillus faecalis TaxID=2079532 RepID=UPI000D10F7EB|nr:D-alanyl-D-alanine carboxypeptidase family protein [Paenibacillus faecalis]
MKPESKENIPPRTRRKNRRSRFKLHLVFLSLSVIIVALYIIKIFIPPQLEVQAAVLINADNGKVLYSHNADQALPPASMSKIMTELIVLEAVHSGNYTWDDEVRVSDYAARVPGSQVGIETGEIYSLKQMFDALVIHSANDAAVAIAEHLSGTETEFVHLMNEKATDIGLSLQTVYGNASGLSADDLQEFPEAASSVDTMMTARDTALLTKTLIQQYPEVLEVTKQKDMYIPQKEISLHTTNLMLPGETHEYEGSNGFKTGYTPQAGYCFTGTAERGGTRLISVIMGAEDSNKRFTETRKLMDYGFRR